MTDADDAAAAAAADDDDDDGDDHDDDDDDVDDDDDDRDIHRTFGHLYNDLHEDESATHFGLTCYDLLRYLSARCYDVLRSRRRWVTGKEATNFTSPVM